MYFFLFIYLISFVGKKLVGASHWAERPIETGSVIGYKGTTVVNGVKQPTIRGPHFDTIYALSNIFSFDVELRQGQDARGLRASLLTGDVDFVLPYPSYLFPNYQTFQIGRFGTFMDAQVHIACAPPIPTVSIFIQSLY